MEILDKSFSPDVEKLTRDKLIEFAYKMGQHGNIFSQLRLSMVMQLLASGDNRHSGSGEKRQFWSNEKRHLQIE